MIPEQGSFYHLGWRDGIFFVDDNLIGNKRYLKDQLIPAIVYWRIGKSIMPFSTEISNNLAGDDELLNPMVEAGFNTGVIGMIIPNDAILGECGKMNYLNRNLVEDIKHIQCSVIQVQDGFILGFDSDTSSIFQRQVEFI